MTKWASIPIAALLLASAMPAAAACSGESLENEFRSADLVVRARVVSETRVSDDEPSSAFIAQWGGYSPVTLHRLRVVERFKGRPGPAIALFQEVASGRFPVDLGGDYLFFLNYIRSPPRPPSAARGATYVRYACGQSKPWAEVDPRKLGRLRALAARR